MTADRLVRVPAALLPSLARSLSADLPLAEAANLLRQAGFDAGDPIFATFAAWAEEEHGVERLDALPVPRFWQLFTGFWEALGWGTLEQRSVHVGVAALDSRDWVEAADASAATGCHLTTGLFADLLRRIAGEDVAVMEAACRSLGDGRCHFLFGHPDTLAALYERMRGGQALEDALAELG